MKRQNHAEQMFQPLESVLVEQNLAAGLGLEIRIRAKICSPVQNRSPVEIEHFFPGLEIADAISEGCTNGFKC